MSSISTPLTYRLRPALQWPAGSGLVSRLLCPFGPGLLYGDPLAQVEYLDSYDLSDPSSFSVTRWFRSIFLSHMTLDIVQLYSDPLDQAEYLDSHDLYCARLSLMFVTDLGSSLSVALCEAALSASLCSFSFLPSALLV